MKELAKPVAQRQASSPCRETSAGPNGAAVIPPAYGIRFVDRFERRENRTGLPDRLKVDIESLSGIPLDGVRVHYNSPKPARLRALAYTQGTEIHVGPGQERHLPHEAWHAVQQMQGRVRSQMRLAGQWLNADPGLESEAEDTGNRVSEHKAVPAALLPAGTTPASADVIQGKFSGQMENICPQEIRDLLSKGKELPTALYGQYLEPFRDGLRKKGIELDKPVAAKLFAELAREGVEYTSFEQIAQVLQAATFDGQAAGGPPPEGEVGAPNYGELASQGAAAVGLGTTIPNFPAMNAPDKTQHLVGQIGSSANIAGAATGIWGLVSRIRALRHIRTVLANEKSEPAEKKLVTEERKGAVPDIASQSMDIGSQVSGIVGALAPAASTAATQASLAAPILGLPVSVLGAGRAMWRAQRAGEHWRALGSMKRSSIGQYGRRQMRKRMWRNLGLFSAGALGASSGVFLTLGAAGLAAIVSNPVGWGLAAAGGAIGLGLGLYKLARWAWKKYKKKTLGKDRRAHAASIVASLEGKKTRRDKAEAEVFVEALGLKLDEGKGKGGVDLLAEKLKSW